MNEPFVDLRQKECLSSREVAAILGCSVKTVYRRRKQGLLRPIKGFQGGRGSDVKFAQNTIQNFIHRTQ